MIITQKITCHSSFQTPDDKYYRKTISTRQHKTNPDCMETTDTWLRVKNMTRDAFQKPPPGHRWGRCSCNNELLRETFHSIPRHRMKKPRTADYTIMPQFNSLSPFLIRAWKYKPLHFLDDDGHRTGLKRDTARCPDLTQHIPLHFSAWSSPFNYNPCNILQNKWGNQ